MKRGRPRKPEDSAGITGSMLQRARAISLHPILETPFGQLAFCREFTDYQVDTAERIASIYDDFSQHCGLRRWAASPSFEVGIGRSPVFEDDMARERAELAMRAFDRLQDQISRFPPGLRFALEELCVQKRACPPGYLSRVKQALDFLAVAMGYKLRKKRLDISRKVAD